MLALSVQFRPLFRCKCLIVINIVMNVINVIFVFEAEGGGFCG